MSARDEATVRAGARQLDAENASSGMEGRDGRELDEARDPKTGAKRLGELARSGNDEVLQAIASHPKATLPLLGLVAHRFPELVCAHPKMQRADAKAIERWPPDARLAAVSLPDPPAVVLEGAAKWLPSALVVLVHPKSREAHRRKARSISPYFAPEHLLAARRAAASLPVDDVRLALLLDGNDTERLAATVAPSITASMLKKLTGPSVFADAVASHPRTPAEVLRNYALGHARSAGLALKNPSTPTDALLQAARGGYGDETAPRALFGRGEAEAWIEQAWRAPYPAPIARVLERLVDLPAAAKAFSRFASHPEPLIRATVAQHAPHLDPAQIAALAADAEWWVRAALAEGRADLPADLIARLAGDAEPRVRASLVKNPAVPAATIATLARDPAPEVRQACKDRPDLPSEILVRIEGASRGELLALVHNPNAPASVLAQLLLHEDPTVSTGAATHPNLPPAALDEVLFHPRSKARRALARQKDLPERLLWALVEDPDDAVRAMLAKRTDLPEAIRSALVLDPTARVRAALARCRHTPPSCLAMLAEDPDASVRKAASANSKTPKAAKARAKASVNTFE